MLIVIAIMLMLVTAAATVMPSMTESRRIRETARAVNIYLSTARNRAMESGRPCGVTFHCLNVGTFGHSLPLNADQCEVPPPYAGDSTTSAGTVTGSTVILRRRSTDGNGKFGDLIQFNCQGPLYRISNINASNTDVHRCRSKPEHGNTVVGWRTVAQ